MASQQEYKEKGYSEAEVEILLAINTLKKDVEVIQKQTDDFVQHAEFEPIQKIVYGIVGVILVAVVSGILTVVLQ